MQKSKKIAAAALAATSLAGLAVAIHFWGTPEKGVPAKSAFEEPRSDAFEALELLGDMRAYPNSEPPGAWQRGFERRRALEAVARAEQRDALEASAPWELIGPTNRGGRTIALAVDPRNSNIVYAGSAGGGLWRMTITGSSSYRWEYIDTQHPVLGVNAIALDPRNSKVIYIGTGEVYGYQRSIGGLYQRNTRGSYGIGLLVSRDSGATWTKTIDWAYQQQRGVLAIDVVPTRPDVVFAGTSEGVYRSKDAGATWEKVHDVLMAVDMAVNPVDGNVVFASCGNLGSSGSGLYRSLDGGDTWTKLGGGLPASWGGKALIDIFQASPTTLYLDVAGSNGTVGIFRSTNNGNTWTNMYSQDIASYQGWFAHYVRVHPTDVNRVMAAGVDFYTSTNGGSAFSTRSGMHVDHHAFANDPKNPEITYHGNDGGVYRSVDGGSSYRSMNNGYATTQFYAGFASSPRDPDLAIGGLQDNGSVVYTGSPSWRSECGGDGTFAGINPQDDNIVYCASQNLSIRRSTDRGQNFSSLGDIGPGGTAFVAPYALAPSNGRILYAGKSIVHKSTDGGDSWQATNGGQSLSGNPAIGIGISPQDPNVVLVSTAPGGSRRGSLYLTTDGGSSYRNVTGSLPDRYYIDPVVAPNDKNVLYVTLAGFGSPHLFRSENGGTTWNAVGANQLPDVPAFALAIDPANPRILYVGTDHGVYVSLDYGASWIPWKDGMPTAALVYDLSISLSDRRIRAVTHGNAVWERDMFPPTVESIHGRSAAPGLRLAAVPGGVAFHLPRAAKVEVEILDLKGRAVRKLASGHHGAGRHIALWDGADRSGNAVPAGSYVGRLRAGAEQKTVRLTWNR